MRSTGWAQSNPRAVQPERPTVATHAGTVAPGYLEIETGGEWDRYSGGARGAIIPLVLKFGVAPVAQLSVFTAGLEPPGARSVKLGDVGVGVKLRLTNDHPLLGRFAIFPSVKFPTGSESTGAGTGTTDVGLLLISSHMLGAVALDLNAGYVRRNGDGSTAPRDATVWTISTGGPARGPVGWVVELFGYPRTTGPAGGPATASLLVGPTFAVQPSLSLDVGIITPIVGAPPRGLYVGGVWNAGRPASWLTQ